MHMLGSGKAHIPSLRGRFSVPLEPERRGILGWMCVLIAVNQFGFGAIVPVIPLYAERYGVSNAAIGFTIAIYGLARFLVNVPAGQLADRRGRRWTLAAGGIVSVIGNLGCALAGDYTDFVVARFIAGAGAAMVLLGGQIVLADIASPANRGRVIGLYQGVFIFAVGIGPLPGGLLADQIGLAAPFLAYAVLAAVVALIAWFKVPETRSLREETRGGQSPSPARSPNIPWRAQIGLLAATAGFLPIGMMAFVASFVRTGGLFNVVPVYAEDNLGLGPDAIGLGLGLISIVSLLMAYPSGMLIDRFGRKAVLVPSMILNGVAMASFALATGFGSYILACAIWSVASGIKDGAPIAYAADIAPPGMNATALSTYRLMADSGYIAGPLLLGIAVDALTASSALTIAAVIAVVTGSAFALIAPETKPATIEPSTVSRQPSGVDGQNHDRHEDGSDGEASVSLLETGSGRVGDSA